MNDELRVVLIIEPSLCLKCRFAAIADIQLADGTTKRMFRCKRLDCDNHQATQQPNPTNVTEGSE